MANVENPVTPGESGWFPLLTTVTTTAPVALALAAQHLLGRALGGPVRWAQRAFGEALDDPYPALSSG